MIKQFFILKKLLSIYVIHRKNEHKLLYFYSKSMFHGPASVNGQNGRTFVIVEIGIGIVNVREAIREHTQMME